MGRGGGGGGGGGGGCEEKNLRIVRAAYIVVKIIFDHRSTREGEWGEGGCGGGGEGGRGEEWAEKKIILGSD